MSLPTIRSRRPLLSREEQGVTFIELFFDLVFVFAITEVTGYLGERLNLLGIGKTILLFWLVWWAWTQFTWALNRADTTHPHVRVATLLATGIAFGMAASAHDAFTADGGTWFGLPYVAVRLVGLGIYLGVGREDPLLRKAVHQFGGLSLIGLSLVVVGSFANPQTRVWWWLAAVLADFVAAGIGGSGPKSDAWQLKSSHFAERYGLFVIIALGESLIAAGAPAVGVPRTFDLAIATGGTAAVVGLLWWTYFGWLQPTLEHGLVRHGEKSAPRARDAFSVLHFPMVGGVIAIAVALKEVVANPVDALHTETTAAFAVGLVLFLGGAAAAHARLFPGVLLSRLVLAILAAGTLIGIGNPTPAVAFTVAIVALVGIVFAERGLPRHPDEP